MFPWLLIIFGIYVVIRFIIGYKKGFTKMAVSLGATILSIILILVFASMITGWIVDHTSWDESLSGRIEDVLLSTASTDEEMNAKIDGMILPDFLKNTLKEKVAETQGSMETRVQTLSQDIARKMIQMGVYVIGFILIWILLRILGKVLDLVAKLPVLWEANKLLGVLLSLLEAWLVIDIVLIGITMLSATDFGGVLLNQVQGSSILSWLFNHNLLAKFLGL